MEPVSGALLQRRSWDPMTGGHWVDVLTGQHVRVELRESTLPPETDTERVQQAARAAQEAWARMNPIPGIRIDGMTTQQQADLFGRLHGGRWRPVRW